MSTKTAMKNYASSVFESVFSAYSAAALARIIE